MSGLSCPFKGNSLAKISGEVTDVGQIRICHYFLNGKRKQNESGIKRTKTEHKTNTRSFVYST